MVTNVNRSFFPDHKSEKFNDFKIKPDDYIVTAKAGV